MIDWLSFVVVLIAAIGAAALVVALYSLGLRLLGTAGRMSYVSPAEFTDALTVITPQQIASRERRMRKAAARSPLSQRRKDLAYAGAVACFVLCAAAVLFGIYLIIPVFHG